MRVGRKWLPGCEFENAVPATATVLIGAVWTEYRTRVLTCFLSLSVLSGRDMTVLRCKVLLFLATILVSCSSSPTHLNIRVDRGKLLRSSRSVTVSHQQDNAPEFDRSHYEAELLENSPLGQSVLQVSANTGSFRMIILYKLIKQSVWSRDWITYAPYVLWIQLPSVKCSLQQCHVHK